MTNSRWRELLWSLLPTASQLSGILKLMEDDTINYNMGKEIFDIMVEERAGWYLQACKIAKGKMDKFRKWEKEKYGYQTLRYTEREILDESYKSS